MRKLACFFLFFASSSLALDPNTDPLVCSNRLVTPTLYKQIRQNQNGNFMFSTLSLELALWFLEVGCKGQTAEEILQALQMRLVSNEALANGTKSLILSLTSSKNYTLNIANGLFVQDNYPIKEEYKRNAIEAFFANIQNVNFAKNVDTAKIINSWVENQTKNKIKDLIDPKTLSAQTVAVLVNTLYFQGNWTFPFPLRYTKKGEKFYKTCTNTSEVDMMVLDGKTFEYANCQNLKAQFLRLPIIGKNASMIIVLPTEKEGLANLEKYPTKVFTSRNLTTRLVNVKLPKFLIRSTINMVPILKQMGVKSVFNSGQADLSGIAGNKGDVMVSDVIQKTYIQVAENGVEAAAATAITLTKAVIISSPSAVDFNCDHPFIFYIEVVENILFAGRVTDPHSE